MKRCAMVMVAILVLTACGGDSGPDSDGAERDRVELDAPDDAEFLVGGDLDLPDWFPPGFGFTDDLALKQVFTDEAMMGLYGETDADVTTAHAAAVASLSNDGYELLSDTENFAVFIRDGVGRIRVRTSESLDGSSTGVTVDIDRWTDEQVEEMRVLSAPEVRTRGTATAVVDGQTFVAPGECIVQGRKRVFVADDFTISASVDEFADPPYAYADVTTDEVPYFMEPASDRDYEINSASPPVAFTVTGVMVVSGGTGEEFDASVEVACES